MLLKRLDTMRVTATPLGHPRDVFLATDDVTLDLHTSGSVAVKVKGKQVATIAAVNVAAYVSADE